ncbi:LysM peptidoglycan-binding domain-containing protein [Capnocytophaga canimorsus]|uniref:LysM peptidoglycan-binding domain-containing protein n=1 Tax=Capnocytophaga canimorsus TaxID=28188 RepID=UPI0037CE74C6
MKVSNKKIFRWGRKSIFFAFMVMYGWGWAQQQSYTVKENDHLDEIAKIYRISPKDILKLNPSAENGIKSGLVLTIPLGNVKHYNTQKPSGFKKHIVTSQETIFGLSQKYGLSMDTLKRYNMDLYTRGLKEGEEITIPTYEQKVEMVQKGIFGQKKYVVKPKEGLWRIAQNHQTTQQVLERMNPGINADNLKEGQEIWIPSFSDTADTSHPQDAVLYFAEKGEGFYSLERKFGLSEAELIRLNPELKKGVKSDSQIWIPKANFERFKNASTYDLDLNSSPKDSNLNLESLASTKNVKEISYILPFRVQNIKNEGDIYLTLKNRLTSDRDKITQYATDFYTGALIALDSLQKMGYQFKVNVFDSEGSEKSIAKISNNESVRKSQLIIGPFLAKPFNTLSDHITSPETIILAPLSNKNIDLKPNVFQTLPSDEIQQLKMLNYITDNFSNSKIFILADAKNATIREKLQHQFPSAIVIDNVTSGSIQKVIAPQKNNLFLLQSNDIAYVTNAIQALHNIYIQNNKLQIVLATIEKGSVYDNNNISLTQLSDLKFTYPSFNKHSDGSDYFSKQYFKTYGILPNRYAIRGFDLTMDAVLRLAVTANFSNASSIIEETSHVENKFFYQKNPLKGGGYENQGVYIMKYENLEIKEANN